jgi:citrate lyase subunit beta/citryl-CoA lyase/(3S)-malyl-CoA thioesterase
MKLRSALFVPCGSVRAMTKARTLTCDALIFDLEDAVGPRQWAGALANLVETLEVGGFLSRMQLVRIQPQHLAATFDALAHLVRSGAISGIVVPKVEAPEDIRAVLKALPKTLSVWAMIETPRGVARLSEIAALSGGLPLKGLIAGPNDLRKSLKVRPMPERADILFALSQIVLHARANDLVVLDGVYNQYADEPGFAAECRQGRALGFDGKTLIHPSQITACEAAFSPSEAEIAWAKAVVAAFEGSDAGVLQIDGEMVERLHLEQAQAILGL